jgi:segregation and condensation protein A
MAVALAQFLTDQWSDLQPNQGWLDFELLLEFWTQAIAYHPPGDAHPTTHSDSTTQDRVGIFWALLLLASQSKVELAQEVFYQDLKVRILSEADRDESVEPQNQPVVG